MLDTEILDTGMYTESIKLNPISSHICVISENRKKNVLKFLWSGLDFCFNKAKEINYSKFRILKPIRMEH